MLIPDSESIIWSLGSASSEEQKKEPSVTIFCALKGAKMACRLIVVADRSDPMRVKYLGGGNLTDIKSIIRSNVAKLEGVKECLLRSSQLMTVNKRHQLAYKAMLMMDDGEYTVLGSYLTLHQKSYELLLLTPPSLHPRRYDSLPAPRLHLYTAVQLAVRRGVARGEPTL